MDISSDSQRHTVAVYGKFRVDFDPLRHRPYGLFLVFMGKRYIGSQLSWVTASDCRWLEQHTDGTYAAESTFKRIEFSRGVYFGKGGPRAKREAHALDIPEDSAPEPA